MEKAAAPASCIENLKCNPTIRRDKEVGDLTLEVEPLGERISRRGLKPYSVYYDLDESYEFRFFKSLDKCCSSDNSDFSESLEICDSSDNSDSESDKRKGVKRNAVGDIIAPTISGVQLKKNLTELFELETGDSEFSGAQFKRTIANEKLPQIASSYSKRAKTHDPVTSLSSNLELEHKVKTLRNKATALRGLLELIQIPENRLLEMDHFLTVICETFSLPLAQYWVITDPYVGPLKVMCQKGETKFEKLTSWCEFKSICLQMRLNIVEGLVGKTYLSHKSLFCRDIIELCTTNYPMAHYSLNCGSIACFTICLHSIFPKYRECVLEFFLPSQKMDSSYPQTLLNSLLATMKEHLPYYIVASGEQLGQVLSVDVINTSTTHNGPQSFKIDQPKSSLSYHEDSKKEGDILYIEKSNSAINSDEATTSGGTSKSTPVYVTEITLVELEEESLTKCRKSQSLTSQSKRTKKIVEGNRRTVRIYHSAFEMNLKKGVNHRGESAADELGDELEEVSPSMSIEPRSLPSQPKRSEEILGDGGNTVKIFHSAMEMTSEEAILQKEHMVAEKRVVIGVEGSTVEDIGCTTSTASQPSNFQTMTSLPQQEVEEDTSTQKLMFEHGLRTRIVGVEKDNTTIHSASKTCIQETSEREKQSKNDSSHQKICEQVGRRLDDAANGCSGDELEKESSIQCIKPQSLTSQPNRSGKISKEIGSTAEIDHSSSGITFEEATNHKEQTEAAQTAGSTVDEPIEESPIDNAVYATSNEDIKTISIASEPSILQTMTLLPRNHVEEDKMVLQDEGYASQQLPCISQPLYRDGIEEDVQVLDITECTPNINPYEEIATDETSKKQPDNVADIICFDGEEESSIQCTEPLSLNPGSKKTENILKDDGNIMDIDHYTPEMILKEAIQYREHAVADQGAEAYMSKRENAFEKDISYESLSQHFGRSLDDARKSFGVSRTAFKKMCREVGITRWKYGKRNMGENSFKPRRRLNDEEAGRQKNSSGMPPVQDTPAVSYTSQDLKKMTVKATYNGVPIRFNLSDLSGLSELQDNVIKRLHLERNSFSIKYQDDEGEWVLIACDEDVRECVEFSRSLEKTTIKMLIDPPVDHN